MTEFMWFDLFDRHLNLNRYQAAQTKQEQVLEQSKTRAQSELEALRQALQTSQQVRAFVFL
jgi:hypothetical protein